MGEVYCACDTRLDRTVAIKVLSPALATNPQFRERFSREGRSISALNHPNICAVYDVGEAAVGASETTAQFLVMEYLQGETLAARLARGPVPIGEAIEIAMEIASALDAAHRHGIIHRDLKPGNVFLVRRQPGSAGSTAKLLDFGLAKIAVAGKPGEIVTAMPTVTAHCARNDPRDLSVHGSRADRRWRGRRANRHLCFLPTGQLIYIHDDKLFAQPFDARTFEVAPAPVQRVEGVFGPGGGQYAVSASGTLIYQAI